MQQRATRWAISDAFHRNMLSLPTFAQSLNILYYPTQACLRFLTFMTSSADESEILTLRQVADFLKVTERTIYRLAAAKKIPAFKVGGTWRFSRAEINQWIQRQQKGGKADKT